MERGGNGAGPRGGGGEALLVGARPAAYLALAVLSACYDFSRPASQDGFPDSGDDGGVGSPPAFASPNRTGVGVHPEAIHVGFFDGGNVLDLAVAAATPPFAAVILLGDGQGGFPNQSVAAALESGEVAAADLDGDGKTDLAVTERDNPDSPGNGAIRLQGGRGDGTFDLASRVMAPRNVRAVATGHFRDPAMTDLVAAVWDGQGISVFLNNGNKTFASAQGYAAGVNPADLAVVDLDGDMRDDLAVANAGDGTISILANGGNGVFQHLKDYPTGRGARTVVAARLRSGGPFDLAVANPDDGTVSLLRGGGDRTFISNGNVSAGGRPSYIVAGDFNLDGRMDLAVADASAADVRVLLGDGAGGLAQMAERFSLGARPSALAVGDFDGDGHADLVSASSDDQSVTVLLNRTKP